MDAALHTPTRRLFTAFTAFAAFAAFAAFGKELLGKARLSQKTQIGNLGRLGRATNQRTAWRMPISAHRRSTSQSDAA